MSLRIQTNESSKSPTIINQVYLQFVDHNQTTKSPTFLSSGLASESLSKSSTKILNYSAPETMSLSNQKRTSCSIFCNYPPFKRARLHRGFQKVVKPSLAENSGSVEEKETELAKQSIKESIPIQCDISKGEVVDESNSMSSSQINQVDMLQDLNQAKNQVQQQFSSTSSSINSKSKKNYVLFKKSLSKSLDPRYYGQFKFVVRYEIECNDLISRTKSKNKQIDVNNPKTYFEREKLTESVKTSPVQESKSNRKSEIQTKTDSRKNFLTKTSKKTNIDLVIVPDAKNPISGTSSRSQSKNKNDCEASPTKQKFTEGIFWLPTLSMQKPKVRKKQNLVNKDKKLAVQNVTNLNDRAISNQANKALSPKPPNQKSRSG